MPAFSPPLLKTWHWCQLTQLADSDDWCCGGPMIPDGVPGVLSARAPDTEWRVWRPSLVCWAGDQSEASTRVMWSLWTNQRASLVCWPARPASPAPAGPQLCPAHTGFTLHTLLSHTSRAPATGEKYTGYSEARIAHGVNMINILFCPSNNLFKSWHWQKKWCWIVLNLNDSRSFLQWRPLWVWGLTCNCPRDAEIDSLPYLPDLASTFAISAECLTRTGPAQLVQP